MIKLKHVHFHVVKNRSQYPVSYKYYETACKIAERDERDVEICSSAMCIGHSWFNYTKVGVPQRA